MNNLKYCPILHTSLKSPSDIAIIDHDATPISYHTFNQWIADWTHHLTQYPAHLPILISATQTVSTIALLFACFRSKRIAFPINPKLPASRISHYQTLTQSIQITKDTLPPIAPKHQIKDIYYHLNTTATYILTSGSSATPKIAVHNLENYVINASGSLYNIPLIPKDRWLLNLPLYHVGGLGILFRCFLSGATVVIPSPETPIVTQLLDRDISHVSMVPTQLKRLLQHHPTLHCPKLQALLIGGSDCPAHLITTALNASLPLYRTYGLTEMTSQVTTTSTPSEIEELTTSGYLLCDREIKLCPQKTKEVNPKELLQNDPAVRFIGERGLPRRREQSEAGVVELPENRADGVFCDSSQIHVKGPCLFKGYLLPQLPNLPPLTHLPLTSDGWFNTGDTGYLDAKGRLIVTGRQDRMFISGGENIHPEEIESLLLTLPQIDTVFIEKTPHPDWGFRPIAHITTSSNQLEPALLTQIQHLLHTHLPKYKHPDQINLKNSSDKTWKQ